MVTHTTHSPGPWLVVGNDVLDADRLFVAEVVSENPLDGALLGAAPELLAALSKIIEGFDCGILVRSIADDAIPGWAIKLLPYIKALADGQAAIARAEGR